MQSMPVRYGRQALGEPDAPSEAQTPGHVRRGNVREAAPTISQCKSIRLIGCGGSIVIHVQIRDAATQIVHQIGKT